jgi:hypothetical protein
MIPSKETLDSVADYKLLDKSGTSHTFSSLYSNHNLTSVIIFIRHFYCGLCQDYLRSLAVEFTPAFLSEHNVQVKVIGCGSHTLIESYTKSTQCPFDIYTDESANLYNNFGMRKSLNLGDAKPEYQQKGVFANSLASIGQALKQGTGALKGGDFRQNGGEFVFKGGECVSAHIMENTRGHQEIKVLKGLVE